MMPPMEAVRQAESVDGILLYLTCFYFILTLWVLNWDLNCLSFYLAVFL